MNMDQMICDGCRTLLMYTRGARSVRCLCCQTVSLTCTPIATIRCGCCRLTLMYSSGAQSVKCALCHFITNVDYSNYAVHSPNNFLAAPPSALAMQPNFETVIIENPASVDQNGKSVNNIVVGVTTNPK